MGGNVSPHGRKKELSLEGRLFSWLTANSFWSSNTQYIKTVNTSIWHASVGCPTGNHQSEAYISVLENRTSLFGERKPLYGGVGPVNRCPCTEEGGRGWG